MPDEGLVVSGAIDALHAEVERLQRAEAFAIRMWERTQKDAAQLLGERRELRAEVERLQARERELEAVVDLTRVVLDSRFHDLIPTKGEWVRLHRSDIENVLLRAKAALAAVSAETPEGHTRMNDGITPSEPTEWLEDLNAVIAEKEADDE